MSEWATHSEELTRKTSTELAKWTDLYQQGRIKPAIYKLVVSVLYDTTVGLIDMNLADIMADIHRDVSAELNASRTQS